MYYMMMFESNIFLSFFANVVFAISRLLTFRPLEILRGSVRNRWPFRANRHRIVPYEPVATEAPGLRRRRRQKHNGLTAGKDRGGAVGVSRRETYSADLPTGWEGTKVRGVSPVGSGGKNHFRS